MKNFVCWIPALTRNSLWVILLVVSFKPLNGYSSHTAKVLLSQADSLFSKKQYVQSLSLYKDLFEQNYYTLSMLLKMAFIEEGMDNPVEAAYYLEKHQILSPNSKIENKIADMVTQHNWDDYTGPAHPWIEKKIRYSNTIALCGAVLVLFFLYIIVYYRKHKKKALPAGICVVLILALMYGLQSITYHLGIVNQHHSYTMKEPSSGSPVLAILKPGDKIIITGQHDVWLTIRWKGRKAYIKSNAVKKL